MYIAYRISYFVIFIFIWNKFPIICRLAHALPNGARITTFTYTASDVFSQLPFPSIWMSVCVWFINKQINKRINTLSHKLMKVIDEKPWKKVKQLLGQIICTFYIRLTSYVVFVGVYAYIHKFCNLSIDKIKHFTIIYLFDCFLLLLL